MTTLRFWWWCWRNQLNPWAVHWAIHGLAKRIEASAVTGARTFLVRTVEEHKETKSSGPKA